MRVVLEKINPKHKTIGIIDKYSLNELKLRLGFEIWENIFNIEDNNIDNIFNIFVNTYFISILLSDKENLCAIFPQTMVNYWY
jgi:high-affinity nickel permease